MNKKWKIILTMLIDAILINVSIIAAYYLRFGRNLNMDYFNVYLGMAPFITIGKLMVFSYFGVYKNLWKYASIDEIINLLLPIGISNGFIIIAIYFLGLKVPRSIYAMATFIDVVLFGITKFGTRIIDRMLDGDFKGYFSKPKGKRTMIVGAGEAAGILIQENRNNYNSDIYPVCAIDDNKSKHGKRINGVPILGDRDFIEYIATIKEIEQIIIAIPSISHDDLQDIVKKAEKTDCPIKILPSISEIRDYKNNIEKNIVKEIRDIDINDLLGRKEIALDIDDISHYLTEKTVLVTGGGGSIGSELCRQIRRFNPREIIVFDISEENMFNLLEEFKYKYGYHKIRGVIGSVRDTKRIEEVFNEINPDIVFHTAAHKHVHFMEDNPKEAIKNNVYGTLNVAKVSHAHNIDRFILISTDKAVNPTNIYGASKRICEMIIQGYSKISATEFVAVRFGNVLGSAGSVIPLFKKQIQMGGPVTITDPEIIRYFMTIPEAVSLVIQAGAMAKGGEIFILDMGKAVKIDELARELIRLSGFEPDKDIKIEYVGLRPGEKLYEELLMAEEGLTETKHDKIYTARAMDIDIDSLVKEIDGMDRLSREKLKAKLKEMVPTYEPREE